MGHQFVCQGLKKWPKMRYMLDNRFGLTLCIIATFHRFPKTINCFYWPNLFDQSKRMVNNQTFQYELFNIFFYLSHLGIFNMSEKYYNCHFLQITLYIHLFKDSCGRSSITHFFVKVISLREGLNKHYLYPHFVDKGLTPLLTLIHVDGI